jgi:hypothetical protein
MAGRLGNLSARERRLFVVTFSVVLVAVAFLVVRGALANLRELDDRIANLEFELEQLHEQYLQRAIVDEAYESVVTVHSSRLTAAEIHDNLRREIYALTQVNYPGKDGKPPRTVQIVRIPTIDEGELKQGEGHREYRVRIDIPSARLAALLNFIGKVEMSDQLLRIDRLDIGRLPGGQTVHASLDITRTVLDNPEGRDAAGEAGAPA